MLWLVVVWLPAALAHITDRRDLQSCGSATFVASSSCGIDYWSCYDNVPCGRTCEGDGECGTDSMLDNCGGSDVYKRDCSRTSPTPRDDEDDDDDDDGDSDVVTLAVSLCVVGAFLAVCGILYVKYPARAKQGFTLVKARCAAMCRAHAKQGFSPVKARRAALTARNRLAMWGGFDLSTATMGLLMSVWLMHEPTRGRRIEPFGTASIVFVTGTSVSIVTSAVVVCFQEGRKSNWGLRLTASFKTLGFLLVLGGLMECLHAPRSCAKAKCIRFCDPNRDGHCPDWASWVVGQTRATGPSKVGTHDRYDNDGLCWNKKVGSHDVFYAWRGLKKYGTWFDPDFDNRDYGDNAWWGFETREDCEADVRRFVDFGLYRLACCLVCIPQLITGLGLIIALCRTEGAKVAAVNAATTGDDTITVEAPPGKLGLKFDGTSTRVKEVFSDSPLVGRVYPGDVLKSVNGALTFGKYLAAAAVDCAAPRTLVFLRKKQPVDLQTGATAADAADGAGAAAAAGTAQLESDLAAARDALKERDRQLEQARADADELRKEVAQAQAERDEARLEAQLRDTPRQATEASVVPGGTAPAQLATVLSVRHL